MTTTLDLSNPTLLYTIESSLIDQGQLLIAGGLGLPEQVINLPEGIERKRFLLGMAEQRQEGIASWGDWNVGHIHRAAQRSAALAQTDLINIGTIDVLAALAPARQWIDRPILDWLTLREDTASLLDCKLNASNLETILDYTEDDWRLAYAFRAQMVNEAEPVQHHVAAGLYVMRRPILPGWIGN